ncbi:MAG TPA: RsfA family transcriptional regulator [Bacillales bacterium]|nr:RsfA family transcriptional regulator [Bacillales bacterium]
MTASRQDAWSREEDLVLAEVVLRHIREGSTQLAAFEEVGERLSRTAAACGFRWNSLVRKKYQSAITLAKKQRKRLKQPSSSPAEVNVSVKEASISLEDVIAYLEKFRSTEEDREAMMKENDTLKTELHQLHGENEKLMQQVDEMKRENEAIQEDYKALIEIMDRARERAILHHNGEAASADTDSA